MSRRIVENCYSGIIHWWIQTTMSSDLTLDFGNHQQYPVMDSEAGIMSIDQGEEWGKHQLHFLERHTHTHREAEAAVASY